jgi:hypothetical protein
VIDIGLRREVSRTPNLDEDLSGGSQAGNGAGADYSTEVDQEDIILAISPLISSPSLVTDKSLGQ